MKISTIMLFQSLNHSFILIIRHDNTSENITWPFVCNPPQCANCILNFVLYEIGVTRSKLFNHAELKHNSRCNNLADARKLIQQNEKDKNELVKQSCSDTITLMNNIFEHLLLKGKFIRIRSPIQDNHVSYFFRKPTNWIIIFTAKNQETYIYLKEISKLKDFLDHCTRERHYFISIKKCGDLQWNVCLLPLIPKLTFDQTHQLPDPTPGSSSRGYCRKLSSIYAKETTEDHRPPKSTTSNSKSHGATFFPSKQYATTTNFYLVYTECEKWKIVFMQRSMSAGRILAFKKAVWVLYCVCGASDEE